jgi:hypothetical protein
MIWLSKMGKLENERGEICVLWADHLVGRAPEASLQLADASVSWRHASVRWTGRVWELQDLGSRNGTFVDGQTLVSGSRLALRPGMRLRFGQGDGAWLVVNVEPPEAAATALDDGQRITPQDGLIALPCSEAPELSIYRQADGQWIAESEARVWHVGDDELLTVAGRRYRFQAGGVVHNTSVALDERATPASIGLEFAVSRNEEQVELSIVHRGHRTELRPRAHTYMLLTLARQRLGDQVDSALPDTSHGWVDQERLLKMLSYTGSQLALDIHRARQQFGAAGVLNAGQVIERREGSKEIRIGVGRLLVKVV